MICQHTHIYINYSSTEPLIHTIVKPLILMMIYTDGRTLKRNETTGVMGGQAQSHAVATKASIKEGGRQHDDTSDESRRESWKRNMTNTNHSNIDLNDESQCRTMTKLYITKNTYTHTLPQRQLKCK